MKKFLKPEEEFTETNYKRLQKALVYVKKQFNEL